MLAKQRILPVLPASILSWAARIASDSLMVILILAAGRSIGVLSQAELFRRHRVFETTSLGRLDSNRSSSEAVAAIFRTMTLKQRF